MTYEEEKKIEEAARAKIAGKLAEVASAIKYTLKTQANGNWTLQPSDKFRPEINCYFYAYRNRDKINILASVKNGQNYQRLSETNLSYERSAKALASEISRRLLSDEIIDKVKKFRRNEQARETETANKKEELRELFGIYSEEPPRVGWNNKPTSHDFKFELEDWRERYKLTAEIKSKYALIQILKILKEDK